jgi:hypothetical protein
VEVSAPNTASQPAYELRPVAGSARYLVYTKMPPDVIDGRTITTYGGLFVLSRNGVTRRIATINSNTTYFSLSGTMLIYIKAPDKNHLAELRWEDLKTGKSGHLRHYDHVLTAAPDGWVTYRANGSDPAVYYDRSVDGPARSLGSPFHDVNARSSFSGSHNLVSYSVTSEEFANGRLRVMSFRHPGVWRTLIKRLPDAYDEEYNCTDVTAKYVACMTPTDRNDGSELRLMPVDGSAQSITTEGCAGAGYYATVMHDSLVWPGCGGRFTVLRPDGLLKVSKHRYGWMEPAFGQVVVTSLDAQRLLLVSSAHGAPEVLVRTK